MSLFKLNPVGLNDFVRVENKEPFISIFDYLFSIQTDVLYNHSKIYPFAYLNKGRMQLFLNKDFSKEKIIPLVKKYDQKLLDHVNEQKPQYSLFTPHCKLEDLLSTVKKIDTISSCPVEITDVTKHYAETFLASIEGWEKVKTSDDIVQDAERLTQLTGRNYSSLRNTLKHVREDLKPVIWPLGITTYRDAKSVFYKWKDKQGSKYFRVTIGRDVRLMDEYHEKVDLNDFFGYVYYINGVPSAANFGCRSSKNREYGQDITVKADIDCKGLGDFAFVHLMQEMNKKGIKIVNDSGGTGKVKLNKDKFKPITTIPMYDLKRK